MLGTLFQGTGLETVTAAAESASQRRRRSRVSPIVWAANFATFRYADLRIYAQSGRVCRRFQVHAAQPGIEGGSLAACGPEELIRKKGI